VNSEFTDPEKVATVLAEWATGEAAAVRKAVSDSIATKQKIGRSDSAVGPADTSYAREMSILFRRSALLVIRDPMVFLGRCVMFICGCCFFAVIYIKARKRSQDQVISRLFLFMWHVGVPTSLGVVAVFAYNVEFNSVKVSASARTILGSPRPRSPLLPPPTDPTSTDPTSTDPTSTDPTSTDPTSTNPTNYYFTLASLARRRRSRTVSTGP
jgi:hypothetical protein